AFEGCTAFVVDRPGTGLSERFDGVTDRGSLLHLADQFVDDVCTGLGVDNVDVIASSFGGFIALHSAATSPERVGRMVQMACPAMAPGQQVPPFMKMMSIGWFRRFTSLFPPNESIGDSILRQIGHGASLDKGRLPQNFKDWYLDLQRYTDTMENDGDMIGTVLSWRGDDGSLTIPDELFASVSAPTLYLWGEDDGFGGRDVAEHVVDLMPDAELEMIPESGHLPWLDFPDQIGERARAFLDG
ncbi:MAG: alpha/beta fold hydrolase, partial [Acidimicrobiia bacterium]